MPRIQIVINSNLILDYLPLFVAAAAVIDDALLYGMHCNCVEARVLRFFVLCVCCVSVFFFFLFCLVLIVFHARQQNTKKNLKNKRNVSTIAQWRQRVAARGRGQCEHARARARAPVHEIIRQVWYIWMPRQARPDHCRMLHTGAFIYWSTKNILP